MARGMNRSAVGFWQRLESRFAALLPRQAYVVRTEGSTVWVRFASEAATAPASQFPTTVAGVAAGTTGWVYPIGGGKGLFVATGVVAGGGGTGAVDSVNGQTGVVVLDADDISDTSATHKFVTAADLAKLANTSGTNTGDQNLAPYALTSSLAGVATSGSYADLTGKPTLGTAAAMASTAFATAAQGTKADSAVQPAGLTKAAVGLANVDNTSDASKPISTATATALSGKAATSHTHPVSDLTATGTRDATTILYGDNTWKTAPGGGGVTIPVINKHTTANQTTTVVTAATVTNMDFAIGASETWDVEWYIQNGCSGTGGIKWAINAPAGATVRGVVVGMAASITTQTSSIITALNTLTTQVYNNIALATGWTRITATIVNGATAGTVNLQFASGTAAQTSTVFANSYVNASLTASGVVTATLGGYTADQVDALIAANKPRVKRSWTGGVNPTTAGDYAVTSGAGPITFTGLTASASYELQWSVSFPMFAFAAARMYPGVRVTDNGGSSFHFFTGGAPDLNPATAGGETIVSWDYSATVTASGIGEVAICPALRWVSGSPYAGVTTFAATISRA